MNAVSCGAILSRLPRGSCRFESQELRIRFLGFRVLGCLSYIRVIHGVVSINCFVGNRDWVSLGVVGLPRSSRQVCGFLRVNSWSAVFSTLRLLPLAVWSRIVRFRDSFTPNTTFFYMTQHVRRTRFANLCRNPALQVLLSPHKDFLRRRLPALPCAGSRSGLAVSSADPVLPPSPALGRCQCIQITYK